ncbi:hypothetical protein ACTXT7_005906 [Hymenolepis weldensis]
MKKSVEEMISGYVRANLTKIPAVMRTKSKPTLMAFGVVNNEGHIMTSPFFPQDLRVDADASPPWIDSVANGKPYVFQQDSAPSHKALRTQD